MAVSSPLRTPLRAAFELLHEQHRRAKLLCRKMKPQRAPAGCQVMMTCALLRNALPVDNKQIREVQRKIESISEDLRVPGVRFTGVEASVNGASKIVNGDAAKILAAVAPEKMEDGKEALKLLAEELEAFKVVVAQKDKQEVPVAQQRVLELVGRLEEDMVKGFPFAVPAPYDTCLLYTSPSPRDATLSRMPSSA